MKIAWRNAIKNKSFSIINIMGLALGLSSSVLILLWVQSELAIDKFHQNDSQLYQVFGHQTYEGQISTNSSSPGILGANLVKDIPEITHASQMLWEEMPVFAVDDNMGKERGRYVQNDFLKMFSYELELGDASTALKDPNSVVISKKLAQKYFNTSDPIGKTIKIDNTDIVTVTGVLKDISKNSSLTFDFLLSYDRWLTQNEWAQQWGNGGPRCFVMLSPNADVNKVNAKIKNYILDHDPGGNREIFLQKHSEVYLHGNWKNGSQDGGRIDYVNIFSIIAVFILLIACINFMNLATARSVKRAKEIGIRKVGGATKETLIAQFMSESLLLSFVSLGISIFFVYALLPSFNAITEKSLELPLWDINFLTTVVSLTVLTGLVSGIYPALFMSSLKPASILKGVLKFNSSSTYLRKGLVVFQFCLAIMLIFGMIVVFNQIDYIQTKNLGFNRENLIYVPIEGELTTKFPLLKQELMSKQGIVSVTASQADPIIVGSNTQGVRWPGKDTTQAVIFAQNPVSYDYMQTMGIKLTSGRDFSPEFTTDSLSYIINESAAKKIGYENPIGKELTFWDQKGQIVGVMEDYHYESIQRAIMPMVIRLFSPTEYWGYALVRIKASQTTEALASMKEVFTTINPNFPFTYQFADEEFKTLYTTESTISSLSNYFAFLAIFISCLGLFGLASFTAEQRTKEIGIRKSLGASVEVIFSMLTKDFLWLILLSIIIAFPIASYFLNGWLEKYTYHISFEWWFFIATASLVFMIALLTVSYQALKAAMVNPVESLKSN